MLGLLVFPQQRYVDQIPEIPLAELVSKDGRFRAWWGITPTLKICKSWFGCLEMLFLTLTSSSCRRAVVNNRSSSLEHGAEAPHAITWKAELSVEDLEKITNKFIALLLKEDE